MGFDPQLLLPALDEAADFIVVMDDTMPPAGPLITYANRSFLEATGYSEQEMIGASYHIFFSPRNSDELRASILRGFERHQPNYKEILGRRKDGSDFWIEYVSRSFGNIDGREYRLAIGRDITLRRRALSQMALLFTAMENTSEAVTLYEPSAIGHLEPTYKNGRSLEISDERLSSIWNGETSQGQHIRRELESGREVQEYFAELDTSGFPRLVQFSAHAIKSNSRIEGIVTLERVLAAANEGAPAGYKSVLLRIAVVLPTLAQAASTGERLTILRAILLDAFEAELYDSHEPAPGGLSIAAGINYARFPLGGKTMVARWKHTLESTALTALRFCIEAAMEQERMARDRED